MLSSASRPPTVHLDGALACDRARARTSTSVPGAIRPTTCGRSGRLDVLAVELDDDVTGLEPCLGRGPIRGQLADQRTAGTIEAEGLGEIAIDVLDRDARASRA
jgi:hypothetical protein